ncbi:hypothetical protein VLK81_01795 [Citroniella saccharovorans]|uniref:Uncharacterized protein n=1 Tax=Citroniella saccharovorans TaxID=2053367 RepID=A0AAW9MWA6_9FIRM|nr:hypothetical protein [Citroniella saccharovorans]MEB3428765.1 hypothetical protein [Citroniella saccharovorans]
MTDNRVIITDYYDFEKTDEVTFSAVAINACKRLQDAGELTTFPIRIHLKR